MQKTTYISMTDALRARPALARGVSLANKIITNAVYVAYPCLLAWLAYAAAAGAAGAASELLRAVLVPGISFALVTVIRKASNAPRPYEVFGAAPVIPKDTHGNSFPSRHAFSIFVIAMTFCACCPLAWVGPVMLAAGVLLAVIRVVSGVHFPRDVVVGALLGVLAGFVGLWIL
ncbi:phosphatase PAP2 family protein [uncultured Senegalimassilia sp.]|uniref:phosphatase PAP2 family protein n=1 Tax=uncultured Senegalimassilia sp. TaxID=1714350 RepID=UPI0027DB7C2E|nr:phosphatase PAP2 family protein [uncultured Senegalimassilia sp.]